MVTILLPILTGRMMDLIYNKSAGFLILYGIGMTTALVEVLIYLGIAEPVVEE